MTDNITELPLKGNETANQVLDHAARRKFENVLILGSYEDGRIRHSSNMTIREQLFMLEGYKLYLLGVADL